MVFLLFLSVEAVRWIVFFGGLESRSSRVDSVFAVWVSGISSVDLDFGVLFVSKQLGGWCFWWFGESKH